VETHLPSLPASPRAARAFLREALQTWNLDAFGEVTEVLTDELVANVVRHVDAPMTVRAYRRSASIRVEVDDPSNDPPVPQHPDPLDEHSRGLLLIDNLASQWGFTQHGDDGKTVWFEIDLTTGTEEAHRSL
jgi:hypothetical protein